MEVWKTKQVIPSNTIKIKRLGEVKGQLPRSDERTPIDDNWMRIIGEAKSLPVGYALKFTGDVPYPQLLTISHYAEPNNIKIYIRGNIIYFIPKRR